MTRYKVTCNADITIYGAGGKGGSVEWRCGRNLNHKGKHKVHWVTFQEGSKRFVTIEWEDLQDTS